MEEFVDSLSMNDKLRKLFGLLDNFDLQDEQLMAVSYTHLKSIEDILTGSIETSKARYDSLISSLQPVSYTHLMK